MRHILITCTQYVTGWQTLRGTIRGSGRPPASVHGFIIPTGPTGIVLFVVGVVAASLPSLVWAHARDVTRSLIIHQPLPMPNTLFL